MDEMELVSRLKKKDIKAFKSLVCDYSEDMILLAYLLVGDQVRANDIVSEILLQMYNSSDPIPEGYTLQSYLIDQVRTYCLLEKY